MKDDRIRRILVCPEDDYLILGDTGEAVLECEHCHYKALREEFIKEYD